MGGGQLCGSWRPLTLPSANFRLSGCLDTLLDTVQPCWMPPTALLGPTAERAGTSLLSVTPSFLFLAIQGLAPLKASGKLMPSA